MVMAIAKLEYRALAHILELCTGYHQLNVSKLSSVEHLIRRQMLIEQAYVDSEVPNYDGAEHFEREKELRMSRV
jgi:hypothetical protein